MPVWGLAQMIKLEKEEFSELISLTIFSCLIPIYSVFFIYQPVKLNDFLISFSLVIPAVLMQKFGFKIRKILPQDIFKKIILVVLTVIGSAVFFKNW